MALYDRIGVGYDTTRQADPYLLSRLIHHLRPRANRRYLDIGSGTGNYTIAMYQAGVPIRGLELSATMLARAKEKAPAIAWHNGRAEAIPFGSASFDGAICTFVHHHMADPVAAFKEVHRVLTPHARLVIFNCTAEQMRHCWLNEYFPRMMKEKATAPYERFVTVDVLDAAGFRNLSEEKYDVAPDLKDLFLYCGKHQPERYLDPRIRSGISSFADAPDQEEVERGVQRIADDIQSGRINDVIRKYAWDGGDYMFTVAKR
ncbi:class I SAM-dependent methyltransferase [Candidatus Binatus sp.]|uniref:class I SAM-dependent methyltransferase n=1 Tax=Candidatus Binatus sp. TaxID=2811406 RepID=UPI003C40B41D